MGKRPMVSQTAALYWVSVLSKLERMEVPKEALTWIMNALNKEYPDLSFEVKPAVIKFVAVKRDSQKSNGEI